MKNYFVKTLSLAVLLTASIPTMAQVNLGKATQGVLKAGKAAILSDADMASYVKESVAWMDKNNKVCDAKSPYTIRLNKLTKGLTNVEGIPLNFKVYYVTDVNAFACPDGSVRVFSSLMDLMTDNELLGIIGHEIGHVAHKHSKKAYRTALLASAAKDIAAASSGKVATLTDSQLGEVSESLLNASFSKKQESDADNYGYDFLKKNGKNPWAMAFAFEKLKKLETETGSGTGGRWQKMFTSHPDTDKRIKRMTERAEKDGIAKPENKMPEKVTPAKASKTKSGKTTTTKRKK